MRKFNAGTTAAAVIVLTILFVSPSAYAFVPPEPMDPTGPAPAGDVSSLVFVSWSTIGVAVLSVIVGAVMALSVERLLQRKSSPRAVAV